MQSKPHLSQQEEYPKNLLAANKMHESTILSCNHRRASISDQPQLQPSALPRILMMRWQSMWLTTRRASLKTLVVPKTFSWRKWSTLRNISTWLTLLKILISLYSATSTSSSGWWNMSKSRNIKSHSWSSRMLFPSSFLETFLRWELWWKSALALWQPIFNWWRRFHWTWATYPSSQLERFLRVCHCPS